MKNATSAASVLAMVLCGAASSVAAQALDDGYYDEARVLQVVPVVGERCVVPMDSGGRTVATVVGSVIGAVIGSKIGEGSGRHAATAIGSTVGGMAGREVYDQAQRQRASVTVCDPAAEQYEVTYEYGGRNHVTRTGYHPGERIRVRVDVRPE